MKSKIITLLGVATIVTLSFSLVSVRHTGNKVEGTSAAKQSPVQNEPTGGFIAEDKY